MQTYICNTRHHYTTSRALGFALGVLHVPVARALVLVPISPRWHALALFTANSTVLQAPVFNSCFGAPH